MGNNKYGNIEEEELQGELDKETGEGKTEVADNGEEIEVLFKESNRYYTVDKDGNVGEFQEFVEDKYPGDITVGTDGKELAGTEKEPYEIWCIEDLIEWSQNYSQYENSYIILGRTLNFKSKLSYADSNSTEFGDINQDEKVEIIMQEMQKGIGFTSIDVFSGVFDGKDFEIENIYIVNTENVGLFRQLQGATIRNLGISGQIESTEITNIQSGVGGIVGSTGAQDRENTIENCWNKATIKGFLNDNYTGVGGILGQASSKTDIINCYNEGAIIGEVGEILYNNIGVGTAGILGYVRGDYANVNIYNSYNLGKVTLTQSSSSCGIMGGIWAEGTINIENCFNIGEAQIGICRSTNSSDNVYYLDSASGTGGITNAQAITKDEINSQEFINVLNSYIDKGEPYKSNWKKWKIGENGYPIFE